MAFIVFAGQSNMGGPYMSPSTLARAWAPDPLTLIWDPQAKAWVQMQPGVNTGYGQQPEAWGPEVQFAIEFRARFPDEELRILKTVEGGTSLNPDHGQWRYDWSPDSPNELFDRAAAMIAEAGAAAGGRRPDAVFFGQGEEDANTFAAAQAYAGNLSEFFAAVRAEWMGDLEGRIGFFQIGSTPPYAHEVRAAQARVDEADPFAWSFDTDFFPRQNDGLHYAAAGYDMVGSGFFRLFAAWEGVDPGGPSGQPGLQLNGTPQPDTLIGGAADDSISGTWGEDFLRGGEGHDLMSGGDAFDDMHGNQGNDTLAGDAGGDWVVGGKDQDRLMGDDGADVVLGNLGDDTCDGGADGDVVRGGQGNDILHGQSGNDWLSGDRGDDTITGGSGADIFNSFGDAGLDRILDFRLEEGDRVRLEPGTTWSVAQVGDDTVVSLTGGAQVVLVGVSMSSLTGSWIYEG